MDEVRTGRVRVDPSALDIYIFNFYHQFVVRKSRWELIICPLFEGIG